MSITNPHSLLAVRVFLIKKPPSLLEDGGRCQRLTLVATYTTCDCSACLLLGAE